ncbi:MAG: DUF2029 domain-containing protein [Clostridia bacterium]|nr:DUF2029 domain-containing protein [Clostridia bacterium]
MTQAEKRFWDFLLRHRWKLFVVVSTLLSLYARFGLRTIVSGDMQNCLLPWYEGMRWEGLGALSQQVGNYNIPYQTVIALMTYLPILPIYAYKGLSILFDYLMAIAVAVGVRDLTGSKAKAAAAYVATIMLPAVLMNSAAWGQCDSIFTCFMVAAFVLLIREKPVAAFLAYGCSFAFKLQALFFLPFLLFYYVWSKRISLWHFLLALVPIVVFSLGALLQGRPLSALFSVYRDQVVVEDPRIAWNYPSFWLLLVKNIPSDGSDRYQELHVLCLAVTVMLLGGIMLWAIQRKKLERNTLLLMAIWMLYTCVFFLPAMHDRYAYPVVIFTLMACFVEPKLLPVALGQLVLETEMYGSGLLFKVPLPWEGMTLINLACYLGVAYVAARAIGGAEMRMTAGKAERG